MWTVLDVQMTQMYNTEGQTKGVLLSVEKLLRPSSSRRVALPWPRSLATLTHPRHAGLGNSIRRNQTPAPPCPGGASVGSRNAWQKLKLDNQLRVSCILDSVIVVQDELFGASIDIRAAA